MSNPKPHVLIIQPYVPEYRFRLFSLMYEKLHDAGYQLLVAAGRASGKQRRRNDFVGGADWMLELPTSSRISSGLGFSYRCVSKVLKATSPSLIILEQAIHNLETYEILMRARWSEMQVAFWGHGETYTKTRNVLRDVTKAWMTRRSSWFFAYSEGGASAIRAKGYPAKRITVLWNSTDTSSLTKDLDRVSEKDVEEFLSQQGAVAGKTLLFLGGVDERKGLTFLLEALEIIHKKDSDIVLLVGGDGESRVLLDAWREAGLPIRVLGRVTGRKKALALRSADLLLIPEWVGLVAVDSLASGVPIVTTNHPLHAPEYEYLTHDMNCLVVAHSPAAYAEGVTGLLQDEAKRDAMARQCLADSESFSIEAMAETFVAGILETLEG